jgi:hypothetical protein
MSDLIFIRAICHPKGRRLLNASLIATLAPAPGRWYWAYDRNGLNIGLVDRADVGRLSIVDSSQKPPTSQSRAWAEATAWAKEGVEAKAPAKEASPAWAEYPVDEPEPFD